MSNRLIEALRSLGFASDCLDESQVDWIFAMAETSPFALWLVDALDSTRCLLNTTQKLTFTTDKTDNAVSIDGLVPNIECVSGFHVLSSREVALIDHPSSSHLSPSCLRLEIQRLNAENECLAARLQLLEREESYFFKNVTESMIHDKNRLERVSNALDFDLSLQRENIQHISHQIEATTQQAAITYRNLVSQLVGGASWSSDDATTLVFQKQLLKEHEGWILQLKDLNTWVEKIQQFQSNAIAKSQQRLFNTWQGEDPEFLKSLKRLESLDPLSRRHHFTALMRQVYLQEKHRVLDSFVEHLSSNNKFESIGFPSSDSDLIKLLKSTQAIQTELSKLQTDVLEPIWKRMAANLLYPEAITSSPLNPQSLEKVQALISEGDSAIDILESLFAAMQLLSLNFEHEAGRITRAVDCINDFSGYLTKTMASFSDISSFMTDPNNHHVDCVSEFIADHDKLTATLIKAVTTPTEDEVGPALVTGSNAMRSVLTSTRTFIQDLKTLKDDIEENSDGAVKNLRDVSENIDKLNNLKLDLSRLCYKDSLSSIVLPVSSDVYDMRDRVRDAALHLQPILKQIEKQIR